MSFGGNASLPIFLDNLKCDGTESGLLQCRTRNLGGHDCTHEEDAGAKCSTRGQFCSSQLLPIDNTTKFGALFINKQSIQ